MMYTGWLVLSDFTVSGTVLDVPFMSSLWGTKGLVFMRFNLLFAHFSVID